MNAWMSEFELKLDGWKEETAGTTGKYAQMDFYELTNGSEPEPQQQKHKPRMLKEKRRKVNNLHGKIIIWQKFFRFYLPILFDARQVESQWFWGK